jgi:predicted transposase/invertase (TIGR01784 family)
MKPSTSQVHDSVIRALFESPDVARAFFSAFLPPELVKRLDVSTLEARPDHLVDPRLGWCATDILYQTTLDQLPAYLYLLLEHQSSVDGWMPYRFLRRTDLIWAKTLAEEPGRKRLPVVVPIVLTHARESWWAPTELQDLVLDPAEMPACLRDKVPRQSYFVFDLTGMSDGQIVSMATTASLRLFLLILRNVRDPNLGGMLRTWHALLGQVMKEPSGLRLMELLLTYLAKAVPTMTQETLMQVGEMAGMDPELVEGSLAWRWLEEGREEGREEGTRQAVLRLLAMRFAPLPAWAHDRVSEASSEQLNRWLDRIMSTESLEDLLG